MSQVLLALLGKVIRHARRVQRALGPGYPELVYHRALLHSLRESGAVVLDRPRLQVRFAGRVVGEVVPDLLVRLPDGEAVLVECKSTGRFEQADFDQMRRYLRAYRGDAIGLLLGFGGERLEFRRVPLERKETMVMSKK